MIPKIKFKCLIPEVLKETPIKKSKPNNFKWFLKAASDFKKNKPSKEEGHTARCPGIINVLNTGWLHCAYQDFTIKTDGRLDSFEWHSEIDQRKLKYGFLMQNYVHFHTPDQLDKFRPFNENTLKVILKIQSPWRVSIPKGYYLLSTSVPFNDDTRFTAATGILKGEVNLNIQLFWHKTNSIEIVKKGTPLCQYFLIKEETIEEEFSEITDKEAVDARYYMDNFIYPV
jgi:hypothetical protein